MNCKTTIGFYWVLVAGVFGTAALADETMNCDQLSALITGNTFYVNVPAGAPNGGTAPIYYSEDGTAVAQLPAGLKLVGTWVLETDQYCIDWDNGPKNSCSQRLRGTDGFIVRDAKLGKPRGLVTRIATGNPEDL